MKRIGDMCSTITRICDGVKHSILFVEIYMDLGVSVVILAVDTTLHFRFNIIEM
jgi:hypothetical protein